MLNSDTNVIVILGPTASGKTRLAAQLSHAIGSEVISADSRQVFRDMNIGTGKDYSEYTIQGKQIPYHLIDIADAGEHYFVHRFMKDFFAAFKLVSDKGKMPVVCGGSGMYIDAVLSGFEYAAVPNDHALRASLEGKSKTELLSVFQSLNQNDFTSKADTSTAKRLVRAIEISTHLNNNSFKAISFPQLSPVIIGLSLPLEMRRKKIEERLINRLQHGLIAEVESLLKIVPAEQLIRYGLEYKYVVMYLQGELDYYQLQQQLTVAIQQFAKRQMTYFRKMERDGFHIHWIDASLPLEEQMTQCLQIIPTFPSLHS
jgi:tRNA dimethylallyltransferase